jgi:hypothetical protein
MHFVLLGIVRNVVVCYKVDLSLNFCRMCEQFLRSFIDHGYDNCKTLCRASYQVKKISVTDKCEEQYRVLL